MKRNRWGIAAAAVGIHICIGSVYAWSVLTKPIMALLGTTLQETSGAFSLAIFCLGMSAAFFGSFVERRGARRAGLLSTLFFICGLLGTAYAFYVKSVYLMYAFYGVIGGIGLGIGYIAPVSTLVKWFPRRKGFATGLAIMGFGFAALIAGPLMQSLYVAYGLSMTFLILAIAYGLVMTASSLYLQSPPDVEKPVAVEEVRATNGITISRAFRDFTAKEAMKNWRFYALWWMIFTNITCGIALLSVASPMAQEVVGMTAAQAAAMVGVLGLVNGGGRLGWASISDIIGRGVTYITFFVLQIIAFVALAQTTNAIVFQTLVFLILTCYGGGFATLPAYIADLFGTKALSNIHGKILTAWAMAGVVGPLLISWVRQTTHSFSATLYIFAGAFVVAMIIGIILYCSPNRYAEISECKDTNW